MPTETKPYTITILIGLLIRDLGRMLNISNNVTGAHKAAKLPRLNGRFLGII